MLHATPLHALANAGSPTTGNRRSRSSTDLVNKIRHRSSFSCSRSLASVDRNVSHWPFLPRPSIPAGLGATEQTWQRQHSAIHEHAASLLSFQLARRRDPLTSRPSGHHNARYRRDCERCQRGASSWRRRRRSDPRRRGPGASPSLPSNCRAAAGGALPGGAGPHHSRIRLTSSLCYSHRCAGLARWQARRSRRPCFLLPLGFCPCGAAWRANAGLPGSRLRRLRISVAFGRTDRSARSTHSTSDAPTS